MSFHLWLGSVIAALTTAGMTGALVLMSAVWLPYSRSRPEASWREEHVLFNERVGPFLGGMTFAAILSNGICALWVGLSAAKLAYGIAASGGVAVVALSAGGIVPLNRKVASDVALPLEGRADLRRRWNTWHHARALCGVFSMVAIAMALLSRG